MRAENNISNIEQNGGPLLKNGRVPTVMPYPTCIFMCFYQYRRYKVIWWITIFQSRQTIEQWNVLKSVISHELTSAHIISPSISAVVFVFRLEVVCHRTFPSFAGRYPGIDQCWELDWWSGEKNFFGGGKWAERSMSEWGINQIKHIHGRAFIPELNAPTSRENLGQTASDSWTLEVGHIGHVTFLERIPVISQVWFIFRSGALLFLHSAGTCDIPLESWDR